MIKKIIKHILFKVRMAINIHLPQYFYSLYLPKFILNGPFKGLNYLRDSIGSVFLPKLIGTYEIELADIIKSLRYKGYDSVIDIGAAEGYYAVGIYKFYKPKMMIAFETSAKGRNKMKRLMKLNNIPPNANFVIEGFCNHSLLTKYLQPNPKSLVIMDIEGYEAELLNAEENPELTTCDIIVEIHEHVASNIQEIIKTRFNSSHQIQLIKQRKRYIDSLEYTTPFIIQNFDILSNEFRTNTSWLYLKSKI